MTAAPLDVFPQATVPDPFRWGDAAACGPIDPTIMDAGGQDAADLCGGCPVRRPCFTYAYVTVQDGYWAGTDSTRRTALSRRGWRPGDPLPDPLPVDSLPGDSDGDGLRPPPRPIRDLEVEQRNGGFAVTVDGAWVRQAWDYAVYCGITATATATGVSTQTLYRLFDREHLGRPTSPRRHKGGARRITRDRAWAEAAWQDAVVRGIAPAATDRGVGCRTLQGIWDHHKLGRPVRRRITGDTVTLEWAQEAFEAAEQSTIAKTARALGIGEKRLCRIWDHHKLGRPRRTA